MESVDARDDGLLGRFLPEYDFGERHSIVVRADAERTYSAIWLVTEGEVALMRQFLWLRSLPARLFGRAGPTAPDPRPVLEQMLGGEFVLLAEEAPRELVVGSVQQFWRPDPPVAGDVRGPSDFLAPGRPGYGRIAMNFLVEEQPAGLRVTTQTRVRVPDPRALRRARWYWRAIYPGSALLRVMWLRAIKRRAEATAGGEEYRDHTPPNGRPVVLHPNATVRCAISRP